MLASLPHDTDLSPFWHPTLLPLFVAEGKISKGFDPDFSPIHVSLMFRSGISSEIFFRCPLFPFFLFRTTQKGIENLYKRKAVGSWNNGIDWYLIHCGR